MSHVRTGALTLAVLAALAAGLSAGQVLERLGLTQEEADAAALGALQGGYPVSPWIEVR